MSGNSEWAISNEQLTPLVELFNEFEGCPEPLSDECAEAERRFYQLSAELYYAHVASNQAFGAVTLDKFHSYVRVMCRRRNKATGKFMCP